MSKKHYSLCKLDKPNGLTYKRIAGGLLYSLCYYVHLRRLLSQMQTVLNQ